MTTHKRKGRRLKVAGKTGAVSVLTALALAVSVIPGPARAEVGPPRVDARLKIVSDSTDPDPESDGEIRTHDIASYLLNYSQNGGNSAGDVVAVVRATNGLFVPANPLVPNSAPTGCLAGSSISADRTTLTCNLGPLTQGTTGAINYKVQASGDVADRDTMSTVVSLPGVADIVSDDIIIRGTAQVDVQKTYIGQKFTTVGGTDLRYIGFQYNVYSNATDGKGGLPLTNVRFTDDWSDLANADWAGPGIRLATGTAPGVEQTQFPVGPSPSTTLANAGTWSSAFSNVTDTTGQIVVTNIAPNKNADGTVAKGEIWFRIPDSSVDILTTNFANRITNVVGTPRGTTTPVPEYNTTNNKAPGQTFKVIPGAYRTHNSAFVAPSYPFSGAGDPTLPGSVSNYFRPKFVGENESSGGQQVTYPGQTVVAESVNDADFSIFTDAENSAMLTCIKFNRTVAGAANASARAQNVPKVLERAGTPLAGAGAITIQYATIPGVDAETKCTNSAGAWTTTRPATFNAVRAFGNVGDSTPTPTASGERKVELVLHVPVTTPNLSAGSLFGFWNTEVVGERTGGGNSFTTSSGPLNGIWQGSQVNVTTPIFGTVTDTYNIPGNSGDIRSGDRLVVAKNVATFNKGICGASGVVNVPAGSSVDYCLNANVLGTGTVSDLVITDTTLTSALTSVTVKPGTTTITNGSTVISTADPVTAATGTRWTVPAFAAPGDITVKFTAQTSGDVTDGESFSNTARVASSRLVNPPAGTTDARNPHIDEASISFTSAKYQLAIEKDVTSPAVTYVNTPVDWRISLTNQASTVNSIDVIDILPWNGDNTPSTVEGDTNNGRQPASNFTGTIGLASELSFPGAVVYYTTEAPNTLSSDPTLPVNDLAGSSIWSTTAPADLSTVTAIRIVDSAVIATNETRSYAFQMTTAGNQAGDVYTNDTGARVTSGATDEAPGPVLYVRSNDVTVTVQAPGLNIVKATELDEATGLPKGLAVDGTNRYTITVGNTGALAARNTVVTDVLRDGLTLVPGSISDGGTYDDATRTISWNLGTVAIDASVVRTFEVTVDRPVNPALLDENGNIPNTANVTSDDDCIPSEDQDERCESTVYNPPLNPHIYQDKTVDKAKTIPGDVLTYTVTVGNDGEAMATDVVASDVLPDEVTFNPASVVPSKGTVGDVVDGSFEWAIGDLAPGEEVTLTFTADINDGEWAVQFENRVRATHNPTDFFDPENPTPPTVENPCEDDATFSCAPTETPIPVITQNKVVDLAEALPTNELTYTVSVGNISDDPLAFIAGLDATDVLPEGVTFVSASDEGVYDEETHSIRWTDFADLAPGESHEMTVVVSINEGLWASKVINKFMVDPIDPENPDVPPTVVENPCVDDATHSCAETVTPTPMLQQDKVVDKAEANPTDTLTYKVKVTNVSSGSLLMANGLDATDVLPEGLTFVSATDNGVYDEASRTIRWTDFADLAPGESYEMTVVAKINDGLWNSQFINRFKVDVPTEWPNDPEKPPVIVDNPCADDATQSCAETVTPNPPVDPAVPTTNPPVDPAVPTTNPPVDPEVPTTNPPVDNPGETRNPPTGDGSGINTGNGTSTTNVLFVGLGLVVLAVGALGVRRFATAKG
jgi:uncharacterized repeat protein (TIGR01451 family)